MMEQVVDDMMAVPRIQSFANIDLANDVNINRDALRNALVNHQNLPDADIYNLLTSNYHSILDEIYTAYKQTNEINTSMLSCLFYNARTVRILHHVLTMNHYNEGIRTCCNLFIYFLTVLHPNTVDKETTDELLSMSKTINQKDLQSLITFVPGLDPDAANKLACARSSSHLEEQSFIRVHKLICKQPLKLMGVQNIVRIYENLAGYRQISMVKLLAEVLSFWVSEGPEHSKEESKIDDRIYYSVLTILNECPINVVYKAVKENSEMCAKTPEAVRCTLTGFYRMDFPRIDWVIRMMEINGEYVF